MSEDLLITASNRQGRRIPRLVVRGMDEGEILALAPAMVCDRVHWDGDAAVSTHDIVTALPYEAATRRWSDGQHRIWVPQGMGAQARDDIAQWCQENDVAAHNMRVETGVPFRNVDAIPDGLFGELVMAAVDWLYPRTFAIRRKLMADLDLIDDDDVRSMMYLFISDHADRYDADRLGRNGTLTFLVFMLGKLRKWPQDAARAAYGRTTIDDQLRFRRLEDESLATQHRRTTDAELAELTGTTVGDVRKRRQAVATTHALRVPRSLVSRADDDDAQSVSCDQVGLIAAETADDACLSRATAQVLTRAVLDSCLRRDRSGALRADAMALACTYLTFWGERTRQDVAQALGVLPKAVGAAVTRSVSAMGESLGGALGADDGLTALLQPA